MGKEDGRSKEGEHERLFGHMHAHHIPFSSIPPFSSFNTVADEC